MNDHTPDPRDEQLRALLEDAVADVEPRPALDRIQARTKVTPMSSKRNWILAAAGAVAATAATVVAVTVITDDDPSRTATEPTASATPTPTESSPAPSESPSESPSQTGPATETRAVPVYYAGETAVGPRLFREFHQLEVAEDDMAAVAAALTEAVGDTAIDPDYESPWPSGTTVEEVTMAGDVLTIDLGGAPRNRPSGMTADEAGIAVQQLVYTAHAVLQARPPVQLLLDGGRTDMVLGVPTAEPLAAADAMEVQATVWITSPQDGEVVGETVEVEGRGAFFEANVSWQLLENGRVVDEGFSTAEEGMTLSPYSFTLEAEPGDYVLRVYDADMSDGEGPGEMEDTKRITVR